MYRSPVYILLGIMCAISIACSGGGSSPVLPDTGNPLTPGGSQILTDQSHQSQTAHNAVMGYYDIYYDIQSQTMEAVENRTAEFTLNVVPFLNLMPIPPNGITFGSIVIHDDDPAVLGIDVEFSIHHPFPGLDQYNAYDLRGVIIGNGADAMSYGGLRTAHHGTDLWMKNPDGYTRWFNPTDFTTELIFGYAPGGFQNLAGDAQVNPYKYYGKHLGKDDNYWSWLVNGPNYDGFFESGSGRTMELEFPMPPDGLGLAFGYAVVVTWEEQGPTGPYYPVHCPEPIAASVTQTPEIWYDHDSGMSGGDLVLDIDLFAWDFQPSTIKIESSVLDGIAEFDAAAYGQPVGDHVSTYHVEAPAAPLTTPDDHYFWVIAEYEGFDYANGLPEIPHADGPLAAFFRYDCMVDTGAVPMITSIDPDKGEIESALTGIEISGSGFLTGAEVSFVKSDDPGVVLEADNELVVGGTGITFDLDIDADAPIGAELGFYDVVVTNPGGISGQGDAMFEVVDNFGVLDPNGGETLYMTLTHEIMWEPGGGDITDISIVWSPDDFTSEIYVITDSTPNDGSYVWAYIPKYDTDTALIRISDFNGPTTDQSDDYFSIKPPVQLEFQDPVTVTNSTVNFTVVTYNQDWDDISPALSQDHDGQMDICWHNEKAFPDPPNPGYRNARDTIIRTWDGDNWTGNGGCFFTWGGTAAEVHELRRDYMKLAPASNNTTYAAIWHWSVYFSVDVDHMINGHNEYNYNYLTNRIYLASEIMADDDYLYLVSDGTTSVYNGPGIYSQRLPTPNYVWTNAEPMNTLTNFGEISHSRSWAFQDGLLVLAYWTQTGDIKLLRQTDYVSDTWDNTEVIFNGSGYSNCKDPSICSDPNGQLFVVWKGQENSSGEYHLLLSMLTSSGSSWTAPMVIATSTTDNFDDQHITNHGQLYQLPNGVDENLLVVGYEVDSQVFSQIILAEAWDWLPSQEVSQSGDVSRDPDVLCSDVSSSYNYDALFTWSHEVTPGTVGYGNYDIIFRNGDFETP